MATTLYLPSSSAAPPISPAPVGSWDVTTGFDRLIMSPTKTNTAMATKTGASPGNANNRLLRQYLYGPLAPVSVPGNVSWTLYVRGQEALATQNAYPMATLYVITPTGTIRGTIRGSGTGTTELATALTSRAFHSTYASSAFSAEAGDYVLLELGVYQASSGSGDLGLSFGDDSAANLTAENITTANNPVLVLNVDLRLFSSGARAYILG